MSPKNIKSFINSYFSPQQRNFKEIQIQKKQVAPLHGKLGSVPSLFKKMQLKDVKDNFKKNDLGIHNVEVKRIQKSYSPKRAN
jgi:glutathione peroxidase-family protein